MSLLGKGIFKGMAVTLKNFALSYVDRGKKERLPTVQYPEEGNTVTPFSRNFPFLIYDGEDEIDGMRCVACQICERECPPACIYIVKEKDENGKFVKRPKVFDIDVSVCMSCQICVEACPFDAIVMDSEFEYSNEDRFGGLLFRRDQLLKSNDYYHKIHPDEARDRDAHLAAKKAEEAAKKKAREEKAAAAAKAAAEKENSEGEESSPSPKPEPKAEEPKPEPVDQPEPEADKAPVGKEPEVSSSEEAGSSESGAEEDLSDGGEAEEAADDDADDKDSGAEEEKKPEAGKGAS